MFRKKPLNKKAPTANKEDSIRYPNLPFASRFSGVEVAPPKKLLETYDQALGEQDFDKAMEVAEQLAFNCGVPGLIKHVEASLKSMQSLDESGETYQQMGMNALIYLNLAINIAERDKSSSQLINDYLPDAKNNFQSYAEQLKKSILALPQNKSLDTEAVSAAKEMLSDALKSESILKTRTESPLP